MAIKKEKKRQESGEELRRLKEDFRDLRFYVEQMIFFIPIAICTISGAEKILEVNRSFENLTRHSSLEITGTFLKNLFQEPKKINNLIKSVKKRKTAKAIETALLFKNKTSVPVKVFCAPREDKEGIIIGYFIAIVDIIEVKKIREKMEQEIKIRTKDLQEKIEELKDFQKLTVGRELKMMELKGKIKELEEKLEKNNK